MVVWEDRGVLKPPKPPIVHATDNDNIIIMGNDRESIRQRLDLLGKQCFLSPSIKDGYEFKFQLLSHLAVKAV